MPALTIRNLEPRDAEAFAAMLAARHQGDRKRLPQLDPALESPSGWLEGVRAIFDNPRKDAVAAERAGKLVGFLAGERMLLGPAEFASQFVPPRSISIGVEDHAVAAGEDVLDVYRAMYAALAGDWVREGFFRHRAAIVPGDAEIQEAWVTLGFGRYLTAGTRVAAAPVRDSQQRALTIERASPEDIELVMELAEDLNQWHWLSPIFWPILPDPQPAAREFNLNMLRSGEVPYFVAYDGGKPAGMQTFLRPGFTPSLVDRSKDVYLFEGVVSDGARGGGIGAALLSKTMAWATNSGFETCTLHWASGNPSGGPFWLSHGFEPIEHTMERQVDDRVAWARVNR